MTLFEDLDFYYLVKMIYISVLTKKENPQLGRSLVHDPI